jgi:cytochrome b6-f complex iron-sulfur subunit
MENKSSRREFCAHAISFVTIASLIEGCGGGSSSSSSSGSPTSPGGGGSGAATMPTVNGAVSGRTVTVNIDAASPLNPVGSAALVQAGGSSYLVTRIAENSFNALTAICTHEQNLITGFSSGRFVCPAHGSQFSTSGAVANGPAIRALQSFPTQFTNGVLTFTV